MKEVSKTGHFKIDLPSSDAATALSGPGNSFLKKFESLTGVSLTIRGLQLEMNGVISKIERASALVELTRPIWEQGLEVPEVDLKAALSSLNMGESSSHAELGKKKEASFRIVACNSTSRRDGRPLQELGFYNPRTKETRLDTEALRKRLTQGAQPTDVVRSLLEKGGLLEKTERPSISIGKAKLEKEKLAKAKTKEENDISKAESESDEAES